MMPHYAKGWLHSQVGEQEQALARMERAIELNPSASNVIAAMSEPLVYVGRYRAAVESSSAQCAYETPGLALLEPGWAQWFNGECKAAAAFILSMAKILNRANVSGFGLCCLGRIEDANAAIAKLLEKERDYRFHRFGHI